MWSTIASCDRECHNIKAPRVEVSRAQLASLLSAPAKASPATAGVSLLSGLKAVLAVHGTVATRLERHSGLLSASGTDYRCGPRFTARISPARLLLLFGLTAWFASLGGRISAFFEEGAIFSGKRECLPAIATNEFLIARHIGPFADRA